VTLYRAVPISQRDGTALANSNCRMASIATGIDYHTGGALTSTGSEMRARQSDQSGGTDSGDATEAWASYGQTLRIRDGETWADAVDDLGDGRLVHLDVWAADCAGPCCDSECGHTIAVAPEKSGTRWLTCDPWCSPPKWAWWDEALLRQGAETWGGQVYGAATAGLRWTGDERALRALMRLAGKRLMGLYRPDFPAAIRPFADTAGADGRIMFTTTGAPTAELEETTDMPINAAPGLVTGIRARVAKGVDWFKDPNLTQRGGSMSSDADVVYVGAPVGETVEGGAYAVQVNTGAIYADGVVRPTIIYLATRDADTYSVPPPSQVDVDEVLDERDEEWRTWLLDGAPGSVS
jgi:hypothetical protein